MATFANDKDRVLAKKLHLGEYQLSTYRVVCGNEVLDFYFDKNADLVTLQGDIVYTLERPTGLDPQQYKAGYSGPSFDCTTAKTTGERLICIDAALSKSDKKLGEAYAALKRELSPASFATFQSAQHAWLAYVMESCGANVPMPETFGDRNVITECLNIAFADRVNLFDGLRAERAGRLVLEPRIRFRADTENHVEESDVYPWMTGGPQAAVFNAFIFKTMRLDRWRTDDKDAFRLDDVGEMRLFARRVYTAVRFDGRVVSFHSTDDFTGGNHDILGQRSFIWDLAKARLITLDEMFAANDDWNAFVDGSLQRGTAQTVHRARSRRPRRCGDCRNGRRQRQLAVGRQSGHDRLSDRDDIGHDRRRIRRRHSAEKPEALHEAQCAGPLMAGAEPGVQCTEDNSLWLFSCTHWHSGK